MKKYEFTGKEYFSKTKGCSMDVTFKQIRALETFGEVKKGDIGGWIESEHNLSHRGNCWIFEHGMVWGNGRVEDEAIIEDGLVYESATIAGCARITDGATISGNAVIEDELVIEGGWVRAK